MHKFKLRFVGNDIVNRKIISEFYGSETIVEPVEQYTINDFANNYYPIIGLSGSITTTNFNYNNNSYNYTYTSTNNSGYSLAWPEAELKVISSLFKMFNESKQAFEDIPNLSFFLNAPNRRMDIINNEECVNLSQMLYSNDFNTLKVAVDIIGNLKTEDYVYLQILSSIRLGLLKNKLEECGLSIYNFFLYKYILPTIKSDCSKTIFPSNELKISEKAFDILKIIHRNCI